MDEQNAGKIIISSSMHAINTEQSELVKRSVFVIIE